MGFPAIYEDCRFIDDPRTWLSASVTDPQSKFVEGTENGSFNGSKDECLAGCSFVASLYHIDHGGDFSVGAQVARSANLLDW
jgi:hypothetical protein